jgi:hypothetical protein
MVRQRQNSGQVLVITALVVALLLMSTVVYVSETQKNAPIYHSDAEAGYWALKQSALHTVTSALVNVSGGGDASVLGADLARLEDAVEEHLYGSIGMLQAEVVDSAPYEDGVWLLVDEGVGVSSITVNFAFNSTAPSGNCAFEYLANVTSTIVLTGSSTPMNETCSQVTVTCSVFADNCPEKAQNLTYYYQDDAKNWFPAESAVADLGNGTYVGTFVAANCTAGVPVLVGCVDFRGVAIWANVTCLQ